MVPLNMGKSEVICNDSDMANSFFSIVVAGLCEVSLMFLGSPCSGECVQSVDSEII